MEVLRQLAASKPVNPPTSFEQPDTQVLEKQLAADQPSKPIITPSPAAHNDLANFSKSQDAEGMAEVLKYKQSVANQVADLERMGVRPLNENYSIASRKFAAKRLTRDGFRVSKGIPKKPRAAKTFIKMFLKYA